MIEPVDALRRIAFLLERSGADTYRVQAFRGAADRAADGGRGARSAAGPPTAP